MGQICNERNFHFDSQVIKAYVASTDIINTSDIGAILQQSTNKAVLAVGGTTAATAKVLGFVHGFREGTTACTGGSTDWFYMKKFMIGKEYEIEYSTLYSTVHPQSTDIGKFVGFSTASSDIGGRLDMDTLVTSVATSSGAGQAMFEIRGFSTARRKAYVMPVSSTNFVW